MVTLNEKQAKEAAENKKSSMMTGEEFGREENNGRETEKSEQRRNSTTSSCSNSASPSSPPPLDPYFSPPPLTLLPLVIVVDFPINALIPIGLHSVTITSEGIDVCVDPSIQLPLLHDYLSQYSFALLDHCHTVSLEPSVPLHMTPYHRAMLLRFVPKQIKCSLERIQLQIIERQDTADLSHHVHHEFESEVRDGLLAIAAQPTSSPHSIINSPLSSFIVVHLSKLVTVCAVKMKYPSMETYEESILHEENTISSADWSMQVVGPTVRMRGWKGPPILDGEFCKISGQAIPTYSNPTNPIDTGPSSPLPTSGSFAASSLFGSSPPSPAANSSYSTFFSSDAPSSSSSSLPSSSSSVSSSSVSSAPRVRSLFHPTAAVDPQTLHSLTIVLVSLKLNIHPFIGQWAQFGIITAARVGTLAERIKHLLDSVPKHLQSAPISAPASPSRTPLARWRKADPSILAEEKNGGSSRSNRSSTTSSNRLLPPTSLTGNGSHHSPRNSTSSLSLSNPSSSPSSSFSSSAFPSSSPTAAAAAAASTPSSARYTPTVRVHLNLNVKIVGFDLAVYQHDSDTLPLVQLRLGESNVRVEKIPGQLSRTGGATGYQHQTHSSVFHPHSQSHPRTSPQYPTRTSIFASPASRANQSMSHSSSASSSSSSAGPPPCIDKIVISLSDLTGTLPHEVHSSSALPFSPLESFKVPGQFLYLARAGVQIESTSPDITLTGDGFVLKWSVAMLQLVPQMFKLVVSMMPTKLVVVDEDEEKASPARGAESPDENHRNSSSASSMSASTNPARPFPYPVPLEFLKGQITNVTVDFPYLLEFGDGDEAEGTGESHQAHRPSQRESKSADADPSHHTREPVSSGGANSPPAPSRQSSAPPPSTSASRSRSPPPKSTSLFSYNAASMGIEVILSTSAWTLIQNESRCACEGTPFLTVNLGKISGAEAEEAKDGEKEKPKRMNVVGSGVEGNWRPAMQLGLYKLIKDLVAASINMKHGIFGSTGNDLLPVLKTNVRKEVDYTTDLMLRSLSGAKKNYIDAFRIWYHTVRDPWLSEPFMHVDLRVTDISIKMSLNRSETLNCFILVGAFESSNVPYHFRFSDARVDFMNQPLVHVKSVNLSRVGVELADLNDGYTEEQHLIAEYLDLSLEFQDVRLQLAPSMDIGPLLESILLKVTALVQSIFDLPSLNYLSRRSGGPGYRGPPSVPSPSVSFVLNHLQIEIVDEPMESFLQHLHLLWLDERAEQERRRVIVKKLASEVYGMNNSNSSEIEAAIEDEHTYQPLNETNSRLYIKRVEELKLRLPAGDSLKKAPLLIVEIDHIDMSMQLTGEYGSFYDEENVVKVIKIRKQEEEGVQVESEEREVGSDEEDEDEEKHAGGGRVRESVAEKVLGKWERQVRRKSYRFTAGDPRRPAMSPSADLMSPPQSATSPTLSLTASTSSLVGDLSNGMGFGFLAGRYFKMQVDGIRVRLRNFPLPLFSASSMKIIGSCVIAQINPSSAANSLTRGSPQSQLTSPAATLLLKRSRIARRLRIRSNTSIPSSAPANSLVAPHPHSHSNPHLHLHPHSSAPDFLPVPLSRRPSHNRFPSETTSLGDESAAHEHETLVSIGGIHSVHLSTKYRPPQVFYDLHGTLQEGNDFLLSLLPLHTSRCNSCYESSHSAYP